MSLIGIKLKDFIQSIIYNNNIYKRKALKKGKKLIELKKSIDEMTLEELELEIITRIEEIVDSKEVESRFDKIVEQLMKTKHGKFKSDIMFNIINKIKDKDSKIKYLGLLSKYIDEEVLEKMIKYGGIDLRRSAEKIAIGDSKYKREQTINYIKNRINDFTDIFPRTIANIKDGTIGSFRRWGYKNPLKIPIKTTETERIRKEIEEFYRQEVGELVASNYEKINLYDFFSTVNDFSIIDSIQKKLPEEIRGTFLLEYLYSMQFGYSYSMQEEQKDRLKKCILENIPEEILINEIIGASYMLEQYFDFSDIISKIDFSAIQNYYRKKGEYPANLEITRNIEIGINTAEELIEELKYIKPEKKLHFYDSISIHLSVEEKIKIVESSGIEDEIKYEIFKNFIFIKDTKLLEMLLPKVTDEKIKNIYKIRIAIENQNYSEVLSLLKTNNCEYEYINLREICLKFSDEQIKEIYDAVEDGEVRRLLLKLSRRKEENPFAKIMGEETLTEEEKLENKKLPKYILVNEKNYIEFLKNAKSYYELSTLFSYEFEEYREKLSFEELLNLYKSIDLENDGRKIFEFDLYKKVANISDLIELIKANLSENIIKDAINRLKENITIDDIKQCISKISEISAIKTKKSLFDEIIYSYIHKHHIYRHGNRKQRKEMEEDIGGKYEEVCELLDSIIDNSSTPISDKYFFLAKRMEMTNYGNEDIPISLERYILKFKELNKMSGKEEYNEIFDFTPQYEYSYIQDREIDITNYWNMIECIPYLNSETVYNKILELYKRNHKIVQKIRCSMLDKDVMQLLNSDVIDFISRYSKEGSSFKAISEDSDKTKLFLKAESKLKQAKQYYEEDELYLANFIEGLNLTDIKNIDEINENELDLIIAISLSVNLSNIFSKMRVEKDEDKLSVFTKFIKERSRKEIDSKLLSRSQALDALGMRFLGISYKEMKEFTIKYASDVEIMINKYKSKTSLSTEEKNEYKALLTLRNIKEILSIKDKNAIVETYNELDSLEEFAEIDFGLIYALDENLRRVYAKDYKENVYTPLETDKKEEIDGIEIYSPKEFYMMVHVVAAYGDFELIDKENSEKSSKEIWEGLDKKENHILCASYISNSNLCLKRTMEDASKEEKEKKNIIFGFNNFGENSVLMGAPYDLGSSTTEMESDKSAFISSFRASQNMIRKTRWLHNEVCIERRLQNQKNSNIEPDYIVCIDEISEESKKVAKDFGIPIVLIDSKEIAKNESTKIENLFKEFSETKSPKCIEGIINSFFSNLNSYRNFRTELLEEYFNPATMRERIEKLIKELDKQYQLGNKGVAAQCYQSLSNSLQNEIEMYIENGIEPEIISGNFGIRELNCIVKQRLKKIDKKYLTITDDSKEIEKDLALGIISKNKKRGEQSGR